jgi:hypothetical protein
VTHYEDARNFASGFGLTLHKHSSGSTRYLGRISKKGDRYLRMLLTHGARSVVRATSAAIDKGKALTPLRQWAVQLQARSNHSKATARRPTSWRAMAMPRCATIRRSTKPPLRSERCCGKASCDACLRRQRRA